MSAPFRRRLTAVIGAVLALSALTAALRRAEWGGAIAGRDGRKVTGIATVKPTADGSGADVLVTLDGDTPRATRPWHIHSGTCAKAGGVVGGARAYTPMAIDAKGHGTAKATLPQTLPDTGTYYINIHDSAAAMGIIVACGDLAKR